MYFKGERICLITGANSGIGKATARGLAELGATVIMVARNHSRGEKALSELFEKTGNKKLYLSVCDLSSQEDILKLVKEIERKYDRIDILVNNAGAFFTRKHRTIDNIEATFAVNYLSRFMLTNLLLFKLIDSKQGRVINVSGEYTRNGSVDFEVQANNAKYSARESLKLAHLADILFTYELSERLEHTNITVNCVHPGMVATNIIYNDPDANIAERIIYKMISPFLKSPGDGAETIIYLASSPEVTRVSGKYFVNKRCIRTSPVTYDKELSLRLWRLSKRMIKTGTEQDQIFNNILQETDKKEQ